MSVARPIGMAQAWARRRAKDRMAAATARVGVQPEQRYFGMSTPKQARSLPDNIAGVLGKMAMGLYAKEPPLPWAPPLDLIISESPKVRPEFDLISVITGRPVVPLVRIQELPLPASVYEPDSADYSWHAVDPMLFLDPSPRVPDFNAAHLESWRTP